MSGDTCGLIKGRVEQRKIWQPGAPDQLLQNRHAKVLEILQPLVPRVGEAGVHAQLAVNDIQQRHASTELPLHARAIVHGWQLEQLRDCEAVLELREVAVDKGPVGGLVRGAVPPQVLCRAEPGERLASLDEQQDEQ